MAAEQPVGRWRYGGNWHCRAKYSPPQIWQRCRTIRTGIQRRGRAILLLANGCSVTDAARAVGMRRKFVYPWVGRFLKDRLDGLWDKPGRGRKPFLPPEVAIHLVKLACERPDRLGQSLSQLDREELARQLAEEGRLASISAQSVHRILSARQLKPWRSHYWMTPKCPRDAEFHARTNDLIGRPHWACPSGAKDWQPPRGEVHPFLPSPPARSAAGGARGEWG